MQGSKHEQVKIDTAHFAHWLGKQPVGESYFYRSRECASSQYLQAHGFIVLSVNYWGAEAKRSDGVIVDATMNEHVAKALSQLANKNNTPVRGETRWADAAKAVKACIR